MAIWTGLKPGSYIVEEVDPADGYSIIQSSETVYLADNGEQSVITVRFENMPDGNLPDPQGVLGQPQRDPA
ncbi:prealbumin-like fold domain-containing protein [Flavonifractor plautii]|nr:prealbumin-like fold domain-containing protein [Flavonifractor plautii]